jgi:type IV secretory pathway VirB2 component (pilin)
MVLPCLAHICAAKSVAFRDVRYEPNAHILLFESGNSPWENAIQQLQTAFTGPIAKGLSLVAIVVGGLMFAFGEGGNKRMFAGIAFGIGMAIAAVNFLSWLFPGS